MFKWENYLFSPPEKIHIFKLGQSIKLLEEKEFDKENFRDFEYLIRFNRKLYYISNKKNNKNEKLVDDINKLDLENCNTFNEADFKINFIYNVMKYDKLLLSNDIDSLMEINYNNISNNIISFEDLIKNNILQEK